MRKGIACAALLGLGLTTVAPSLTAPKPALADDAPFQSQPFAMDGVVKAVDVDRDRVTFQGSDGKPYTLDTSQSDITLVDGNKAGMTADLSPGNRVHVSGHLLSSSIAEVDQLRVLDDTRPPAPRPASPRGPQGGAEAAPVPIDFRGTVDSVDTQPGRVRRPRQRPHADGPAGGQHGRFGHEAGGPERIPRQARRPRDRGGRAAA